MPPIMGGELPSKAKLMGPSNAIVQKKPKLRKFDPLRREIGRSDMDANAGERSPEVLGRGTQWDPWTIAHFVCTTFMACGDDEERLLAVFVVGLFFLALIICLLVWLRPDRKITCLVKLFHRLRALYTQISLRAKCVVTALKPLV